MKKKLFELLRSLGIIDDNFTGQLTLHLNQGSIVSYDKYVKGLKIER
jgi:hypothetical protein